MATTRRPKAAPLRGDLNRLRTLAFEPFGGDEDMWIHSLAGGLAVALVGKVDGKWASALVSETWIRAFGPDEALKAVVKYRTLDEALTRMLMFDLTWLAAECGRLASDICGENLVGDAVRQARENNGKKKKDNA